MVFESDTRGSDPNLCPADINKMWKSGFFTVYSFSIVVRCFLSFWHVFNRKSTKSFYVAAHSFHFSHVFRSRMEHLMTFVPAGFIALKTTSFWDGYCQMCSGSSSCSSLLRLNMQLNRSLIQGDSQTPRTNINPAELIRTGLALRGEVSRGPTSPHVIRNRELQAALVIAHL